MKFPQDIKIAGHAKRFLELYVKVMVATIQSIILIARSVPTMVFRSSGFKVQVTAVGHKRRLFKLDC